MGSVTKLFSAFHQMQWSAQSHTRSSQSKYKILFVLTTHRDMEGTGFIGSLFVPWNSGSLTLPVAPHQPIWESLGRPKTSVEAPVMLTGHLQVEASHQAGTNSDIPHLPSRSHVGSAYWAYENSAGPMVSVPQEHEWKAQRWEVLTMMFEPRGCQIIMRMTWELLSPVEGNSRVQGASLWLILKLPPLRPRKTQVVSGNIPGNPARTSRSKSWPSKPRGLIKLIQHSLSPVELRFLLVVQEGEKMFSFSFFLPPRKKEKWPHFSPEGATSSKKVAYFSPQKREKWFSNWILVPTTTVGPNDVIEAHYFPPPLAILSLPCLKPALSLLWATGLVRWSTHLSPKGLNLQLPCLYQTTIVQLSLYNFSWVWKHQNT